MLEGFLVLHARGKPALPPITSQSPWRYWQTCVRSMALGFTHFSLAPEHGLECYQGREAYKFMLEVASGLHSPIVGETEIFGQFKNLVREFGVPLQRDEKILKKILESINCDVKFVRNQFLLGVGKDSYGSYVRRQTKDFTEIHILGAGHLALEIAPWLLKTDKTVKVQARNLPKAKQSFASVGLEVEVEDFASSNGAKGALIICAPSSSRELNDWIVRNSGVRLCVDLRAESGSDPIAGNCSILRLADVFEHLQSRKLATEKRVQMAFAEIQKITQQKFGGPEHLVRAI